MIKFYKTNTVSYSLQIIVSCLFLLASCFLASSCARMGQPDGGWYDETPPRVIRTTPEDKSLGVKEKKMYIYFNEFVTIDNPTENVTVSPPQIEAPDIRTQGKRILVQLNDTLQPNTTYTIDFSDAITDNTEQNPLGNYTYTFSTGTEIDTLEVAGYVVDAETLDPVKGILVGLYNAPEDSLFTTTPLQRVAKTDHTGHFTIRGVAPGSYRIYALGDVDGDYRYTQKSEQMAFLKDIIVPSVTDAVRQDTIWRDTLHIERINQTAYTRFLPDDVTLRAFTAVQTDRYLLKAERQNAEQLKFFFTYGDDELPSLRGLNFDATNAFFTETTERKDTITYWLRDTTLVNRDSLEVEMTYRATDSLGVLCQQTDTLLLLAKTPYAKRQKELQKKIDEWQKQQNKKKRRGEPYDSIWRPEPLSIQLLSKAAMAPDENVRFSFNTPLATFNADRIHLYSKIDTLWYDAKFAVEPDSVNHRQYILRAEWRPDIEYSLEIDSAAFVDIYGKASDAYKTGLKINSNDTYSTILVQMPEMAGKQIICQLLDTKSTVQKTTITTNGQAEFFYLTPSTYFLRIIVDDNNNGRWDTGDFQQGREPEQVFFYEKPIECRAKWDVTLRWNPQALPLFKQKPAEIVKKEDKAKKQKTNRNIERARKLGIEYTPNK